MSEKNTIIEEKVKRVVADHKSLEPAQLASDVSLEDIGYDDLDKIEIVMKLEEMYMIEISDNDADLFLSINDMIQYLQKTV